MKHITLHITRQEVDANGRRKIVRVKVADTDVPQVEDGSGIRNVPLLLTHAMSIGGNDAQQRLGFDYVFDRHIDGSPGVGGFPLGEETGFPYVFNPTDDPDVFGFELLE